MVGSRGFPGAPDRGHVGCWCFAARVLCLGLPPLVATITKSMRQTLPAFLKILRTGENNTHKMVKWPLEHFVELIAWLNYSLSHEGINFQGTIIEHLKASCEKEYTFEQVKRKLRSAWTSHGPKTDSQYTWNDLYNHGSQILSRLTDEQLEAIAKAHARLEDGATAKLLSARERPRTRSASKSDNFRFSPHISLESLQTNQSPQYYKKGQTGSMTPCPTKRESEPCDLSTYEGLTPRKRAKVSSPLV